MHIRMTDKGRGREKIALDVFLPYAQAYTATTRDSKIYIATDNGRVISQIHDVWPQSVVERIVYRKGTLRSQDKTAVFDVFAKDRHRTNTEALVEIYAMSRCNFIVHGYSAMSEATIYINYQRLHNHSVCLYQEDHMSVSTFQSLVASASSSYTVVRAAIVASESNK
jgi:hypothetical protein